MARRPFVPALIIVSAACVQQSTVPKAPEQTFGLQIRVSSSQLAPGATDTITVSAMNPTADQVRILFPTSCQIEVFIRNTTSQTVVPPGGRYDCVPIPSQMVLPSNGTVEQIFVWKGGSAFYPPGSAQRLPAGDYFISATMVAQGVNSVAFAVKVSLLQ